MKTPMRIILAILLLFPACNRKSPSPAKAESEQQSTSRSDMERQRDDYVRTVRAKLDEFDHKIDGLEARASKMTGTTKQDFTNDIDQLKAQRKMVARKLDDLKKVNVESWMTLKGEVDSALSALQRSYEMVSSKYEPTPAKTSRNTRTSA